MEVTILETWPGPRLNHFMAKIQFPIMDIPKYELEYSTTSNQLIKIKGIQLHQTPNAQVLYDEMDNGIYYCLIEYLNE